MVTKIRIQISLPLLASHSIIEMTYTIQKLLIRDLEAMFETRLLLFQERVEKELGRLRKCSGERYQQDLTLQDQSPQPYKQTMQNSDAFTVQFLNNQMSSSLSTISALVNTMIGGTMLTIPMLFREAGIGYGLVILFFSGLISYKTCELYVIHMSEKENSIEETIRRILGARWEIMFKKITGFYLVCLNAIYIDLIVDQCYNIIYYIFNKTGHGKWVADKDVDHLVFDKFSVQYLSIFMFLPIFRLTLITNFKILLKLTSLGILAVIIYIAFIFYEFSTVFSSIQFHKIPFFGKTVGNLLGTCAIAFTIHTVVNPIIKANLNQKNNLRDLRVSYFFGFLIYASIGVLGCISVLSKTCKVTIVNCYLDSWQALSVEIVYFLMLLTVYPCFIEVGRTRLMECYFQPVTQSQYLRFNLVFVSFASFFAFLGPYAPLDLIMNLVGSILCFFFVYMVPVKFHWHCLYRLGRDNQSLVTEEEIERQNGRECAHSNELVGRTGKGVRFVVYWGIILIGIAIGIYGIYGFFKNLFFE